MKKPIVKKKTAKIIKKIRPFAIPAAIFTAGAYAYGKTPMARKTQNMRIEMQKITKERLAGKKYTRKETVFGC